MHSRKEERILRLEVMIVRYFPQDRSTTALLQYHCCLEWPAARGFIVGSHENVLNDFRDGVVVCTHAGAADKNLRQLSQYLGGRRASRSLRRDASYVQLTRRTEEQPLSDFTPRPYYDIVNFRHFTLSNDAQS